jgi:N-acetylmuramoyl-L-alanine amidase
VGNRRLAVLRQTRMPSVIVEVGFMSNDHEVELLYDSRYRDRLAAAIAKGVHAWG